MKSEQIKKTIFLLGLIILFGLPALPTNLKAIGVAFFALVTIFTLKGEKFKFNTSHAIYFSLFYLFLLVSFFYTENKGYGLKKLETMSSLLFFPIIVSIIPKKYLTLIIEKKRLLLSVYVFVIVFINIAFFIYHFGHYKETLVTHYITVIRIAQDGYNIHPIYMSMHLGLSLLFCFYLIGKEDKLKHKVLIGFLAIMLLFFLFLLLKKGPIIAFFIGLLVYVIFQRERKTWILFVALCILSFMSVLFVPKLKSKFVELTKIETIDEGDKTSTNIRYSVSKYVIKMIRKAPVFGHGVGDSRDELNKTYKDNEFLYSVKHNSHNQYLGVLAMCGIVGLILLLILVFKSVFLSYKYNNVILAMVVVFYGFVMFTENILEREDGVIFFSMFINIFSIISKQNNKECKKSAY